MGYNLSDVYPSNYLKAADLEGKTVMAEIVEITLEKVGTDEKLVAFFKNQDKGLVLNKTNSNNIALVYGMDTDGWIGGTIQMYPTMVDFQGRSMEAIRVKAMPRPAGRRQGPSPQQFPDKGSYGKITSGRPKREPDDPRTMQGHHDDHPDDEIPF
jgi:replicative superfamily II helicase